jgi:hypothetical protein
MTEVLQAIGAHALVLLVPLPGCVQLCGFNPSWAPIAIVTRVCAGGVCCVGAEQGLVKLHVMQALQTVLQTLPSTSCKAVFPWHI